MKDYYAILGVLPTTEDVVVRAAYRALAQKYHPDKNGEADHHKLMVEINEAYSVLSDATKRRQYDEKLKSASRPEVSDFFGRDAEGIDPLERDWAIACKFHRDLQTIEQSLSKLSSKLAFAYRAYLLDQKAFDRKQEIADNFIDSFFETYFGSSPILREFVLQQLHAGNRHVAIAVNEAVRVLGTSADAGALIDVVRRDFPNEFQSVELDVHIRSLARKILAHHAAPLQSAVELLTRAGATVEWRSTTWFSVGPVVTFEGKVHKFDKNEEMFRWVKEKIAPRYF